MSKEREFLHDIASPLTTLQLNIENALAMIEEKNSGPDCVQMLNSCLEQLNKAHNLIRTRRDLLIAETAK